jgi:hypothetical protein
MAFSCTVNFLLAGFLALAVSLELDSNANETSASNRQKELWMLVAFAGLNVVATLLVWLFMRTPSKPTSLEDMDV